MFAWDGKPMAQNSVTHLSEVAWMDLIRLRVPRAAVRGLLFYGVMGVRCSER